MGTLRRPAGLCGASAHTNRGVFILRQLSYLTGVLAAALAALSPAVHAQAAPMTTLSSFAPSALSVCLADHSSGKDRKEFARWIFAAISQHPVVADLSATTPASREEANRSIGAIVTRLIAVDCVQEAKAAMSGPDGNTVFGRAFASLGELAMQEIMTDPQVAKGMQDLPRYLDRQQFEAAFKGQ